MSNLNDLVRFCGHYSKLHLWCKKRIGSISSPVNFFGSLAGLGENRDFGLITQQRTQMRSKNAESGPSAVPTSVFPHLAAEKALCLQLLSCLCYTQKHAQLDARAHEAP